MSASGVELAFARFNFGKSVRIRAYQQIERLVANGVPLLKAMEALYDRASRGGKKPKNPEAIAFADIIQRMMDGQSFGKALDGWAPYAERMLIEAGETSGELPKALANTVSLTQSAGAMLGAVIGGLAYPAVLVAALIFVLYMFGTQIIPTFAIALPMEYWTGLGKILADISSFVQQWTFILVGGVGAAMVLVVVSLPRWAGGLRVYADRVPPWSMYRLMEGTGFLLSLAALTKAGVPIVPALEKMLHGATPWMRLRIRAALREVTNGQDLGTALAAAGHGFPDRDIIGDLKIYSTLQGFDEALDRMGREWVDRGLARVRAIAQTMNTLALLLLAGTIMFLTLALFDLSNQIGSMVGGM